MRGILRRTIPIAFAVLAAGYAAADDETASHRWRIEVSEGSHSDGAIRFVLAPTGGELKEVVTPIAKGRSENDVARDIRDAFVRAVDPASYEVEVDDGEDVVIKAKKDRPEFHVAVIDSTAKGVRIDVERD